MTASATARLLLLVLLAPAAASAQDLTALSAQEAAKAIRDGQTTSRALTDALLKQAEAKAGLNAFITLNAAAAREAADRADAKAKAGGPLGPLHGVPIVVKDNINAAGMPTTAGTPARTISSVVL